MHLRYTVTFLQLEKIGSFVPERIVLQHISKDERQDSDSRPQHAPNVACSDPLFLHMMPFLYSSTRAWTVNISPTPMRERANVVKNSLKSNETSWLRLKTEDYTYTFLTF